MQGTEGLEGRFKTLGFQESEAKVYLELLRSGETNGSRLSSACGLARTTTYAALEALLRRGAVIQTLSEPRTFRARPPSLLFEESSRRCAEAARELSEALKPYESELSPDEVWNISNEAVLLAKARELIDAASGEVLINTDWYLEPLGPALQAAALRGIKVLHVSFTGKRGPEGVQSWLNTSYLSQAPTGRHRIMLAVDMTSVLVASRELDGRVSGVFSSNPLLTRIIAEHIHHDIYLVRIKEAHGGSVLGPGLRLGSMLESDKKN